MDGGRGKGANTNANAGPPAGAGRGGLTAPPGGGDRKTTQVTRKPLDANERLSIYGLDLENLKFDTGDSKNSGSSQSAEDFSVAALWQKKGAGANKVATMDGSSMFGNFDINVKSSAKPGTELGFEFKAILDNDYQNFSAEDFDINVNASSFVLSGVSMCDSCKKSIVNPADGVVAFGKAYHRNHLKCCVTGKDFTSGGDAFEGEDGLVYSQAEWEKKFQKSCAKCAKTIKEKKPISALNKFYHRACFTCSVCAQLLGGRWFEDEGKPVCENDHYKKRGLVCPVCQKHVEGEAKVCGKIKFHRQCLSCAYCRKEPENHFKQVAKKPGKVYCVPCGNRIFPDDAVKKQ